MKEMNEIEKRTVTINRTFDAPIKTVWEAWTQPEHIVKWWGPAGMNTRIIKHDFSEGGEWEFAMTMPDGNDFITNGIYQRIVVESLIETTADFKPMTEGVTLLIEFIEKGQKTEFIFKVIHPTEAYRKKQEEMGIYNGWGSTFDRLDGHLSGITSA